MADLERALADLGANLAYPPTPDLAATVRARLATEPAPRRPFRLIAWPRTAPAPRRALLAAAMVLLFVTAALLAVIPDARSTVAEWFGLDGVRIVVVDETPTPAASPVGTNLLLGERVTLAEARARVAFDLVLLDPSTVGEPDEVYVREVASGMMVSLLYRPRPGLPEAAETGVGALLMQFAGGERTEVLAKKVASDTVPLTVRVDGAPGFWIYGSSALVIDPDPSIGFAVEPGRPSANVLFWQRDGVTYRLETDLLRADAIRLAETVVGSR